MTWSGPGITITAANTNSNSNTNTIQADSYDNNNYIVPANEISYWTVRHENLQNIYEQLNAPSIKSIAYILQQLNSIYSQVFLKIFKELIVAVHEAQDISLWLSPFQKLTAGFGEVNFVNSFGLIEPLVHIVHFISIKSKYYCTTKRIGTLVRTICNLLILRAYDDLETSMLFHGEADEGLMKITKTMEILEYFK